MCYPNSNPIPAWVVRFVISVNCTAKLFRLATKPPFLWDNGWLKRIPLTLIYNPAKPRAIAPYDPHQPTVSCNLMHAVGQLKIWARAGKNARQLWRVGTSNGMNTKNCLIQLLLKGLHVTWARDIFSCCIVTLNKHESHNDWWTPWQRNKQNYTAVL